MATSVGAAAAQGIESGFGLGMRGAQMQAEQEDRRRRQSLEDADRAERSIDRTEQRARLAKQDQRLATSDERQARLDTLSVLDKEVADLKTEGSALWTQFGGYDKVPEDVRGKYTVRVKEARQRRAQERRKFYEPDVTEAQRDAAEKWSRIQAGQMSIDDLSDDDLYRTLTVQTRRDMADFLRPKGGGPAPIEQAALDLEAGMQTGNMDLTLRAANMLLKPELSTGVGTEGRDGSEIVDKRIVKLVPHPQDPSQFVPIVEVTVKRDDGAMGKYLAPVSEGRGVYANDPEALPKTLTLQQALDRVGQLTTLASAVNRPDLRERIEKGAAGPGKQSADEFLAALGAVGVEPPKKQITTSNINLDDRVLIQEHDSTGNLISERTIKKGPRPSLWPRGGGPSQAERGIAAALQRGDITADEAREARRRQALGIKPADEAKAKKMADKDLAQRDAAVQQADRLISTVDSAMGKIGSFTTGLGSMLSKIPGSDARDLASELDTIKANLGFAELQAMREASPTGGALGAIAVQELVALQSTVASLDQRQSPAQLKQSLAKIREHYRNWRDAVTEAGDTVEDDSGDENAIPKVNSDEAYNALPSGAMFIAPDGTTRRKP